MNRKGNSEYLWLGLLALLALSCERILDYDTGDYEPEVAVNSVINPDSLFTVHLSLSTSILDTSDIQNLTGQQIEVYEDDQQVETLMHSYDGYYCSGTLYPEEGRTYELKIHAANTELTASTTVPVPVEIMNADTLFINATNWFVIQVTFADPPGESNYYQISLLPRAEVYIYLEGSHVYTASLTRQSVIDTRYSSFLHSMGILPEESPIEEIIINKYGIFSDQLIDGETFTLNAKTPFYFPADIEKIIDIDPDTIPQGVTYKIDWYMDVYLLSLNRPYFDYLKSKNLHDVVADNVFFEPMGIISNINNGIGIFGSYASSRKSLPIVVHPKETAPISR
jgi:hypothetical protein